MPLQLCFDPDLAGRVRALFQILAAIPYCGPRARGAWGHKRQDGSLILEDLGHQSLHISTVCLLT